MRLSLKLSCPAIECLAKSREGFLIQIVLVALFLTSCVSRASRIRSVDLLGNPAADGDIALVGEDGETADVTADKGNVLIYHGGQLWSVCDDHWNDHAAAVVCRSLGYAGATGHTTQSFFGQPDYDIGLDDVNCTGTETSLLDCGHSPFGVHNCDRREAAGVICSDSDTSSTTPAAAVKTKKGKKASRIGPDRQFLLDNELFMEVMQLDAPNPGRHKPSAYTVRLAGGRQPTEGRVEVEIGGRRGVICSDRWTQMEARVACRQAGHGYARVAIAGSHFGGTNQLKLAAGIECDGDEQRLSDCYHAQSGFGTSCPSSSFVAGVVCTTKLPDLVPNTTLLEISSYLQDRAMYYLQCAMEEGCASSTAFQIRAANRDWHVYRRRLLRFSSSTWNFGTAPFLPANRKDSWEWHLCHMHYHSMSSFAQYDILDTNGNRVAEGHKASFCLEDVRCMPGVTKKYACAGFGDQGISVGCADDYLHDIDCQWIDITDVKAGTYVFKVKVNPEYTVAELDYNNNAAICKLVYSGGSVNVSNCVLGRG